MDWSLPESSIHGILTRQEYWNGMPFPSPGDLPDLGIEPRSPTLQADALPSEPPGKSTEGKLGLILMGRAMLSKSLIQFSIDGWSCVPYHIFTWGQTMVEAIKIMETSFKRSHACTATFSAPNPAAGHRRPTPLLETPGHSVASLGISEKCRKVPAPLHLRVTLLYIHTFQKLPKN